MTFDSAEFLVLLLGVVALYFHLPLRWANGLLLSASCAFYMAWRPEYILLILFSTGVDYAVACGLGKAASPGRRRALLLLSLVSNLGLLLFFKYHRFAGESLRTMLGWWGVPFTPPLVDVLLPVGISFYTFQALSYTVDVYRGITPVEKSFPRLFLYVMFFPQLVAGPIERSNHLLPQFGRRAGFEYERVAEGCRRVLWGLFKKVVIADRLAAIVDTVYDQPQRFSGVPLVLATYAFAFQIYADFSAYSDIAIGSARVLGFEIMENFRRPYFAPSLPEFWRRWHVSLSTWFRDYLYIPLGGNRVSRPRWLMALLATFLLSGLWHGARWTFVAWGAYHGILVALSLAASRRLPPVFPSWLRAAATFHLVVLGWILFRSNSMADAVHVISHLFSPAPSPSLVDAGIPPRELALSAGLILTLLFADFLEHRAPLLDRVSRWPVLVRWVAYAAAALAFLNLGAENEVPFVYFQF